VRSGPRRAQPRPRSAGEALMSMERRSQVPQTTTLADLLDRVLDKGLVVAGDVSISLANVELLTIRIRLLVCSIDNAEQIGLNWWKHDPNLTTPLPAPISHMGLPPAGRVPRRQTARTSLQAPTTAAKVVRKKTTKTNSKKKS